MTWLLWVGSVWLVVSTFIGRILGAVIGTAANPVLSEAEHFALWEEQLRDRVR